MMARLVRPVEVSCVSEQEPENQVSGAEASEETTALRARRRSCLVSLNIFWLAIGLGVVVVVFIVKGLGLAERDSEKIAAHVASFMDMKLPDGFYAFAHNQFMGTEVISFYDGSSLREAALSLGHLSPEQFDEWVRPADMTKPKNA